MHIHVRVGMHVQTYTIQKNFIIIHNKCIKQKCVIRVNKHCSNISYRHFQAKRNIKANHKVQVHHIGITMLHVLQKNFLIKHFRQFLNYTGKKV